MGSLHFGGHRQSLMPSRLAGDSCVGCIIVIWSEFARVSCPRRCLSPNRPIKKGHQSENQRGNLQACTLCPLVLPFPCLCLSSLALARTDLGACLSSFPREKIIRFWKEIIYTRCF